MTTCICKYKREIYGTNEKKMQIYNLELSETAEGR